jgi:hypothetical protein
LRIAAHARAQQYMRTDSSKRRLAMNVLSHILDLLMPHPSLAVESTPARAQTSALDGRNFDGVVLERGKTSGDADTLIFSDGRFRSTACDQYGYADGPYTASVSGDAIAFEAETESPKYGKLLWKGVVRGHKLDGTLTMVRDGKPAGEKWVVAGEAN